MAGKRKPKRKWKEIQVGESARGLRSPGGLVPESDQLAYQRTDAARHVSPHPRHLPRKHEEDNAASRRDPDGVSGTRFNDVAPASFRASDVETRNKRKRDDEDERSAKAARLAEAPPIDTEFRLPLRLLTQSGQASPDKRKRQDEEEDEIPVEAARLENSLLLENNKERLILPYRLSTQSTSPVSEEGAMNVVEEAFEIGTDTMTVGKTGSKKKRPHRSISTKKRAKGRRLCFRVFGCEVSHILEERFHPRGSTSGQPITPENWAYPLLRKLAAVGKLVESHAELNAYLSALLEDFDEVKIDIELLEQYLGYIETILQDKGRCTALANSWPARAMQQVSVARGWRCKTLEEVNTKNVYQDVQKMEMELD